jgi:hypothetical protein
VPDALHAGPRIVSGLGARTVTMLNRADECRQRADECRRDAAEVADDVLSGTPGDHLVEAATKYEIVIPSIEIVIRSIISTSQGPRR